MIKIDMTSNDVDKQIEVLKHFPDLAEKHYRPALQKDVKLLSAEIEPNIPQGLSGRSKNTFSDRVLGKGFSLKGEVGWYDKGDPYYIRIVDSGAAPHDFSVAPAKASVLAWGDGAFSQGHTIHHPGFSERGFMAAGYSAVQPIVERDLAEANERIVADLAAI